jgi:hypothetical protein
VVDRVGAGVAELGGIGQGADADRVEDDERDGAAALHAASVPGAAPRRHGIGSRQPGALPTHPGAPRQRRRVG